MYPWMLEGSEEDGIHKQMQIDRMTKEVCPECNRTLKCGRVDGSIPLVGKFHHKLLPNWRYVEVLKCLEKETHLANMET